MRPPTDRETDRQTDRYTDIQAYRDTDRLTDRHADILSYRSYLQRLKKGGVYEYWQVELIIWNPLSCCLMMTLTLQRLYQLPPTSNMGPHQTWRTWSLWDVKQCKVHHGVSSVGVCYITLCCVMSDIYICNIICSARQVWLTLAVPAELDPRGGPKYTK